MNNKLPQISFVYNRRKTASPTKKASVEIRITHNYKQKWISTGVMLYPHQWKDGNIINCPDIIQISQTLDAILKNIKQVIYEMIEKGSLDISLISTSLNKKQSTEKTFLSFCKQRAAIRKFGKKQDTQERYDRFLRMFETWGGIVVFDDITEESIMAYDIYLSKKGMKAYSKWNNYHRFLNSFIMDAVHEGLLKRNPYRWLNIKKEKESKGISRCLTPKEFERFRTANMPTDSITKVRDLFIFQTFTCLSYVDLKNFRSDKIQKVNGTNVYVGKRAKTNTHFTIPLLQPAIDILKKYNWKLPIISNVKYNEYLKVAAQTAGIDKPISTHWARHTGATLLLNKGVPMQIVSKICGHSSTRITEQVYAKLLDETVVDALNKI